MPLKVYETQEAIPEGERDAYVEHEGQWHPSAVVALEKERGKREKLLGEKRVIEQHRRRLEREQESLKAAVLEHAQKDHERGMAELTAKHEQELAKRDARLRVRDLESVVLPLLGRAGAMGDRIDYAVQAGREELALSAGGGLVVLDDKGQPTNEEPAAWVQRFRAKHPWLFAGCGASGSGASGSW